MTGPINQSVASALTSTTSTDPFITIFATRDPTSNDIQYPIQKRWYNTSDNSEFILESFSTTTGFLQAIWGPITGSSGGIQTLTGNTGGAVPPTASNVNIVGTGSVTVTGNPGSSTLTISAPSVPLYTAGNDSVQVGPNGSGVINIVGTGAINITGNAGTHTETVAVTQEAEGNTGGVVPFTSAGLINIIGSGSTSVAGNGGTNTLTITTTQTATGNSGGTVPFDSSGNINIVGTAPVSVVGTSGSHTLTISNTWTGTTDDSTVVPVSSGGNVNFHGSGGITTSGNAGTNTITISGGSSGGISWSVITADQSGVAGHGYLCNKGSQLTLTLPSTASIGDTIEVVAFNSHGFKIAQNSGQSIQFSGATTTVGTGGSVASNSVGDWVRLVCSTTNTGWIAFKNGNFTVI